MDSDLILAKAGSVRAHLNRISKKCDVDLSSFMRDIDRQEIILFNIQMAIQNCIDIAAHIISEEAFGVPGSTTEMLYFLEENGYLDKDLTQKMIKAVGLRNLIVHEYVKIELEQVYKIAQTDINDLNDYLKSIITKLGIADKFL